MEVYFTPMISIWSLKNSNLNIDLYHTKVEITITNRTQITGENNEWLNVFSVFQLAKKDCILALCLFVSLLI